MTSTPTKEQVKAAADRAEARAKRALEGKRLAPERRDER